MSCLHLIIALFLVQQSAKSGSGFICRQERLAEKADLAPELSSAGLKEVKSIVSLIALRRLAKALGVRVRDSRQRYLTRLAV
jgi:hypothetical protein